MYGLFTMIKVFDYTDYRNFLNDWCDEERKRSEVFSFRNFSRKAGISSSGFLKLVMDGKRDLTDESLKKFIGALSLDKDEAAFFDDLVRFNQAKTHPEKNHHYMRMMNHRRFFDAHRIERESFNYFSKWYYTAIREMIALPDFQEDPEWIAARLNPAIDASEVTEAINVLLDLGLAKRNDDGKLAIDNHKIATDDEIRSVNITNYHRSMIRRAEESLANYEAADRSVNAITVPMSEAKFDEVKERLNEFRKELWAILADCEDAKEVYQINFQLFGLTRSKDEE